MAVTAPPKLKGHFVHPTHAMPLSSLDICPTVHGGNEPPDHSPESLSSVRADTTKEKTKWLNMNMKDYWTWTPTADSIKRHKTTREEISNIDDNVLRLLKHTQLTRAMRKVSDKSQQWRCQWAAHWGQMVQFISNQINRSENCSEITLHAFQSSQY